MAIQEIAKVKAKVGGQNCENTFDHQDGFREGVRSMILGSS